MQRTRVGFRNTGDIQRYFACHTANSQLNGNVYVNDIPRNFRLTSSGNMTLADCAISSAYVRQSAHWTVPSARFGEDARVRTALSPHHITFLLKFDRNLLRICSPEDW
jgi:hypothetical protein